MSDDNVAGGLSMLSGSCTICNTPVALERIPEAGRVCEGCGATRQSIELTAALLATIGHGLQPFLNRLNFEEPMRSARVLDLSGDLALSQVFWVVDHYRAGRHYAQVPPRHLLAKFEFVDFFAEPADSVDLLILRNVLTAADDLAATIEAIARVLAPGGWAVIQDRFDWPVPPQTSPASPGADGAPRMRGVGGGLNIPDRHVIGAGIVDTLAALGMMGEFYRPNLGLDPLFRNVLLTAMKV